MYPIKIEIMMKFVVIITEKMQITSFYLKKNFKKKLQKKQLIIKGQAARKEDNV